jgi:hypothetical protein
MPPLLDLLADFALSIPWGVLPFFLLGLIVAAFQARNTLWGLYLPMLAGLCIIVVAASQTELYEMTYTPLVMLSAYGIFRVARGIEQGVRNSSPSQAKSVIPALTFTTLTTYAGWLSVLIF